MSSVIVYSMQDNHYTPIDPPDGLTFSKYGIPSFNVQIRDGASWKTIATVTGNNLVKRAVTFDPVDITEIRISLTSSAAPYYSYVAEIEVFGIAYVAPITTTTLNITPTPVSFKKPATLTATVSGNYPSGLVHFYDGITSLGDPVALVNGSAGLSSASLSAIFTTPGSHTIKADYGGDRNNIASSGTSLVQVNGPMLVPLLMLLLDEN